MTRTLWADPAWPAKRRHFRDLAAALATDGFTVIHVQYGGHLRLRVARAGRETTITLGNTPRVPEHAVTKTMQQARRGTRP